MTTFSAAIPSQRIRAYPAGSAQHVEIVGPLSRKALMLGATLFKGENRRQWNLPVGRPRKPTCLQLPVVDQPHHVLAREAKSPRHLMMREQLLLLSHSHRDLLACLPHRLLLTQHPPARTRFNVDRLMLASELYAARDAVEADSCLRETKLDKTAG